MEQSRYVNRFRSSMYKVNTPSIIRSKSPKIPIQKELLTEDSKNITHLIEEIKKNPTSKVWISVGSIKQSVSNDFALTMLLSGCAHVDVNNNVIKQRTTHRTAFDLRGRGKICKEDEDEINFMLIEDL